MNVAKHASWEWRITLTEREAKELDKFMSDAHEASLMNSGDLADRIWQELPDYDVEEEIVESVRAREQA